MARGRGPGSVLPLFNEVFQKLGINNKELEEAEDDLDLPEMSVAEMTNIADTGIDMKECQENIEIADNGTFSYKKRPVVVYIKDQYLTSDAIMKGKYTKYHLCYCKALQTANAENRFYNRYVMVRRIKGDFWMRVFEKGSDVLWEDYDYRKLNICQDCLRKLNWKNFNSYCGEGDNWWQSGDQKARNRIVTKFSIQEFLAEMRAQMREKMNTELKKSYIGKDHDM